MAKKKETAVEEVKVEEVKAEEGKAEEVKAEEVKTEEAAEKPVKKTKKKTAKKPAASETEIKETEEKEAKEAEVKKAEEVKEVKEVKEEAPKKEAPKKKAPAKKKAQPKKAEETKEAAPAPQEEAPVSAPEEEPVSAPEVKMQTEEELEAEMAAEAAADAEADIVAESEEELEEALEAEIEAALSGKAFDISEETKTVSLTPELLEGLVEYGKSKNNVLDTDDINAYFKDVRLSAEQIEQIMAYLEARKIDALKDEIEDLKEQISTLEDKVAAERSDYLRLMAEFETFRRRTAEEKLELVGSAATDTIKGLLPVLDDCERALEMLKESSDEAAKEGTSLIYNKLMGYLQSKGLEPIVSTGEKFDTDFHEAVAQFPVPEEDKKGKVFDTVETGYTLNGKVIRFAKVVVGI